MRGVRGGMLALLLVSGVAGAQTPPVRPRAQTVPTSQSTLTAADLFSGQNIWLRQVPLTEEWNRDFTTDGWMPNSRGGWEKSDSTGTVRASAYFTPTESTVTLRWFPANGVPIVDVLLTHLLRSAESTTLEGDGVQINFAPETRTLNGKTRKVLETALLVGSIVTRRDVYVIWSR